MSLKSDTNVSTDDGAPASYDESEYELATPLIVDGEALYLDKPTNTKTLDGKYASLANLRNGYTWTDSYFHDEMMDGDDNIIAVFDFDCDKMETFYTSMGWATIASTLLYTPFFVASLIGCAPCYLRKNVQWSTRTKHVAITQDGIRYVHDRRPCCWGLSCTDQGKTSKTVPFDKITDCDIEEPAGNSCLCVPNILSTVNVDTASSGGAGGRKELKLAGLKDPHSFKKLVWAMKRAQRGAPSPYAHNDAMETMDRGSTNNSEEVALLLREIRDELRVNNSLLQNTQKQE